MARNKDGKRNIRAKTRKNTVWWPWVCSVSAVSWRLGRPFGPVVILSAAYLGLSWLLWQPLEGASAKSPFAARSVLTREVFTAAVRKLPRRPWLSSADYKELIACGMNAAGGKVFTANAAQKWAAACAEHPWVARVDSVRLRWPAQAEIRLTWRVPTALVRTRRGTVVVDREGTVVPSTGLRTAARLGQPLSLPLVTGLRIARPVLGEKLSDPAINEASALIALVGKRLAEAPVKLRLREVQRLRNGTWRLKTDRGPDIIWGVFSDLPPMDEPRTDKKLALLSRRLVECGDPGRFAYLDLRFPNAQMGLGRGVRR